MKSLDTNATTKALDLLGITNEIPIEELYDKLYEYRLSQHPDKYTDEEAKKLAEENFKLAGNLLDNLKRTIEVQIVEKKPNEIIHLQRTFDIIQVKQVNVEYQDEIQRIKNDLYHNEYIIKDLKKELKSLRKEKLKEKTDDLVNKYKPSGENLFSNGLIFVLSFMGLVFTRIEHVALFIGNYSPFPQEYFNIILFAILLFVPFRLLFIYIKQRVISKVSRYIVSPIFINLFFKRA